MSMDPNGQCSEAVSDDRPNDSPSNANLSKHGVSTSEAEDEKDTDDEDEDLDFNPFLKNSPSLEASSSLSSESESLDYDTPKDQINVSLASNILLNPPGLHQQDYALQDLDHGKESVTCTEAVNEYVQEKESENDSDMKFKKKRKLDLISHSDPGALNDSVNNISRGVDDGIDVTGEGTSRCQKLFDIDDNDAISRRTRARCSLASFTLDELETFLQETDDEDDFKNANDEEEYQKFLASVLQVGDGDGGTCQENENIDDEDEESDADFELELEEALESDLDENIKHDLQEELKMSCRRPTTRQNKCRAAKLGAGNPVRLGNRSLRPILPSAPISSFPVLVPPNYVSSSEHSGAISGFTPYQLAQLHCLMYEHTQLLIQVYCLCIFEPSRKHIASQSQELIMEMLHKRDQAIHQRRNLCASGTVQSSDMSSMEKHQYASNGQEIQTQTTDSNVLPSVAGPIPSVLDITPLSLVGNFIDDVTAAMQEYQQKCIQATCDNPVEKDPLFPFQNVQSSSQADTAVSKGIIGQTTKSPSFPNDCPPKRTLAATIVEKTKKQSIALVPKSIAKLTQRFYPMFNPALFPHKPPPPSVANRVLFTDAEDELLALGLMEYNTDWETIQQRFLPCKSKHQIFVRQKNRSSSKAPENSIKAIRRMKNSLLTADEVAHIQEGLKVFKHDWMSVWKFVVPYRDPSLLPRQWRIANGTQKSYKATADKKEKRRLYAFNKRNLKPASHACRTNTATEENSGDDCVDNQDETYVHEAFLADWRPGTSIPLPSEVSMPIMERNQPNHFPLQDSSHLSERMNSFSIDSPSQIAFKGPTGYVSSISMSSSHSSQGCSKSDRARTRNSTLVKLAPGLPPVNLPPSVRVMSQSAFTSNHQVVPLNTILPPKTGVLTPTSEEIISALPQVEASGRRRKSIGCPSGSAAMKNKPLESNSCLSDLDMHPLFFQAKEDGQLPYYPPNSGNLATCLTPVSGNQPQPNLSLNLKSVMSKMGSSSSCANAFDFHPLLQKEGSINDFFIDNSANQISCVNSETLREEFPPRQSKRNGILPKPRDHCSPKDRSRELDLDIRLSSTPRKNMATTGPEQNLTRSALDASGGGSTTGHETRNVCHKQSNSDKLDSLVISGDNAAAAAAAACGVNDEVDQFVPEIVMEQEELSDSDEEIGEDVEFEHEEMTDSDDGS
ncbi:uncharacterized protein LOC124929323 [Impatiens glandulifera]|uniref:uncharacterized protein LOC124929323 n=1 Tax=Impatiens glandulifera TaxID=253017 RepID=UPI001FB14DF9|nr:uncharacterized protein LOC124929323 [Impatiens glandulifera]